MNLFDKRKCRDEREKHDFSPDGWPECPHCGGDVTPCGLDPYEMRCCNDCRRVW